MFCAFLNNRTKSFGLIFKNVASALRSAGDAFWLGSIQIDLTGVLMASGRPFRSRIMPRCASIGIRRRCRASPCRIRNGSRTSCRYMSRPSSAAPPKPKHPSTNFRLDSKSLGPDSSLMGYLDHDPGIRFHHVPFGNVHSGQGQACSAEAWCDMRYDARPRWGIAPSQATSGEAIPRWRHNGEERQVPSSSCTCACQRARETVKFSRSVFIARSPPFPGTG